MYHDLQKAHMKQLKSEKGSCLTSEATASKKKGFVSNCLLKVAYSGEVEADVDQLKVGINFCQQLS